jgi:MFS family permease
VFATVVGTTVEWYDFFIYATAVGLVFGQLFFAPAGEEFGQILAFLTVGISFLFRPLGAFLAGHFGDKYGRKVVGCSARRRRSACRSGSSSPRGSWRP